MGFSPERLVHKVGIFEVHGLFSRPKISPVFEGPGRVHLCFFLPPLPAEPGQVRPPDGFLALTACVLDE